MAAGNFLPTAELTSSGRPVLLPNEIEVSLISKVDLQFEPSSLSADLKSGLLILTTHRLLWLPESNPTSSTTAYIPLASISHIYSLKKSIKSMFHSPRLQFQVLVGPDGRVNGSVLGPGTGSRSVVVTVVMRGKGDVDGFVGKFWENWRGRAWERDRESGGESKGGGEGGSGSVSSGLGSGFDARGMRMVGVAGILRREQEMWESTDKSLQEAFHNLNALMVLFVFVFLCFVYIIV